MNTSEGLEGLIHEAATSSWGPELAAIVEKALALAVEQGDESGEYRVRLIMGNNAQMSGDTDMLLTNFAWCLAKHDQDPLRFPAEPDEGSDLMWQFKWMAGVLGADPRFSREQIAAVMEDMDQHYRRANLGMSGVAMARFELAFYDGHLEDAREAFATLNATERDDYSHCEACVRSVAMDYYLSIGDVEQGIGAFAEIMDGGFSCGEEPENAISMVLLPLLRAGDVDGLDSLHRRSLRAARNNADNLGIIANHVVFCAVTGNEARGVALAERHSAWLAHDPLSHRKHLNFLTALGLLMEKVVAGGNGEIPIRGSDSALLNPFLGERQGVLSAQELAPLCWAAAEALAADFDDRNGNSWHAQQVRARRELVAETHPLPLGDEALTTLAQPAAVEPQGTEEWRIRAIDLAATGQYDAALAAYASGVRGTEDPRELASLHRVAGGIYASLPGEKNTELLRESVSLRAAALRAAGDETMAALAERTTELLDGPGNADNAEGTEAKLALITKELASLTDHPEACYDLYADRAYLLIAGGHLEQARVALTETEAAINEWAVSFLAPSEQVLRRARAYHSSLMLRLAVESDDLEEMSRWVQRNLELETYVVRRATSLGMRARLAAQRGELVSALADAEESTDLLLSVGARETAAQSSALTAAILADMGRTEEFRSRLRFGIAQARLAESPQVLGLAYTLSRDLVEHGSNEEAIEIIDETLNNSGLDIGDHDRGELYELLGMALRGAGELGGAVNAWAVGITAFAANGEADRVAQLHLALSSTYQEAGYLELAAQSARQAVDTLASALESGAVGIEPQALIAAHMQLAEVLSLDDDDTAAATIETASTLAVQADSGVQAAQIQLIRARHLFRAEEVDAAVAQALQAASALETLDDGQQQSVLALLQAAHMLDNAKRHDDAVAIYHSVLEELQGDPQGQEIVRHQLADCLEAGGRNAEAAAVRAEAEEGQQRG